MSVRSFSALSNPEMSRRRGLWPHTGRSGFVFTVFDGSGYNKKFIFIANKLPRLSLSTPLWMRVRCTVWTTPNNNNKNKKKWKTRLQNFVRGKLCVQKWERKQFITTLHCIFMRPKKSGSAGWKSGCRGFTTAHVYYVGAVRMFFFLFFFEWNFSNKPGHECVADYANMARCLF